MKIETSAGVFEESELAVEIVAFDSDELFAFDRKYRKLGSDAVIAVYRDVKFRKVNTFAETPETVETTRGLQRTVDLEKKFGQIDNDNEFSCWVEYRAVGEDEIIHRSADVKLKKLPASAQSQAGGI